MLYIAKNVADRDMPCWFSYLSKNDNNKEKKLLEYITVKRY